MFRITPLVIAALLILSVSLSAKNGIYITNSTIEEYPSIELEYFIFNNGNNLTKNISTDELVLFANTIIQDDKSIECPQDNISDSLSVLFVIDTYMEQQNLDSTKYIISEIRNSLNNSQFALSSLNTVNNLYFDFNQNFSSFEFELEKIRQSDFSNPDTLFLSNPIGIDKIFSIASENSDYHVVYITDKKREINTEKINTLKNLGIKTHILSVDNTLHETVSQFYSSNDDLFSIDEITSKSSSDLAAAAISSLIKGEKPCKLLVGIQNNCDSLLNLRLSYPAETYSSSIEYNISKNNLPRYATEPLFYGFSSVLPGTSKESDVIITALNEDIQIDTVFFENDYDGVLSIVEGVVTNPITLPAGQSYEMTLKYSPLDSNIVFSKLIVESSACTGNSLLITGGYPNTPPKEKTIQITAPNECNETLIVGDKYDVSWTGLLPSDVIQLEYSTNNGMSWDTLATNVTGLNYEWTVPDLPSTECLVRGIQLWPNNIGRTLDLEHNSAVNSAFFNNIDGTRAVTGDREGLVRVWNTNTGDELLTMEEHTSQVNYAVFSPDDQLIASASDDEKVVIWDANNGEAVHVINEHTDFARSVNFSPDGSKFISSSRDGTARIYDTETGDNLYTLNPDGGRPLYYAAFHPSGDYYCTGGLGGILKVWNSDDNTLEKEIDINNGSVSWIQYFSFNSDGSRVLIVDQLKKNTTVWDFNSDTQLFTLKHTPSSEEKDVRNINSGSFITLQNQEYILTSGVGNRVLMWNSIGDSVNVFLEHKNSVQTAVFNFDASRVLTASWDSTAKVWNLDERDLQMDTSDCTFRISNIEFASKDLDFGNVVLGRYKDSILVEALSNLNNFQFEIRQAYLTGQNAGDFSMFNSLTNEVVDTLDGSNFVNIDVRFKPINVGIRTAVLNIVIPSDTVRISLKGNAIAPDIENVLEYVIFSPVDVGDFKDRIFDIVLRNNSTNRIKFDSVYIDAPRIEDFSISEGVELTELNTGEENDMILRFAPKFTARTNATLTFTHDGNNSPTRISLLGSGREAVYDTTTIKLSDFEGNSGELSRTDVLVNQFDQRLLESGIEGVEFDISYNSTILAPRFETIADTIVNGIRTSRVKVEFQDNIIEDLKISKVQNDQIKVSDLEFFVALGNDSTTNVSVSNSSVVGSGKLLLKEESSIFRLLDLCEEGGKRLFDTRNSFGIDDINPNPVSLSNLEIEINLLEEGFTTLELFDSHGNKLKSVLADYLKTGEYSVNVNLQEYANGNYFFRLKSPNQTITKKFLIQR